MVLEKQGVGNDGNEWALVTKHNVTKHNRRFKAINMKNQNSNDMTQQSN